MEGTVLRWIMECLPAAGQGPLRATYDDRTILLVAIWAILHDRSMAWACEARHWPDQWRPDPLPSPSTMSRRWVRAYARHGLAIEDALLKASGPVTRDGVIDARPLCVGGATKDPDAKAGRAVGHFAKGYKLFSVLDARGFIRAWEVHAMNRAEPTVAANLYRRLPEGLQRIVGDGVYDSMRLHGVATEAGLRHYAPIRQQRVGRRQQPRRKQLLKLFSTDIGRAYLKSRDALERSFAHMSNISCGLKGLPNWVRRQGRVERWVWGKILIYHAYKLELAKHQHTNA